MALSLSGLEGLTARAWGNFKEPRFQARDKVWGMKKRQRYLKFENPVKRLGQKLGKAQYGMVGSEFFGAGS